MLDELNNLRDIEPIHLLLGAQPSTHVVFSPPGLGKTGMLRYLHWFVSCNREEVLKYQKEDPRYVCMYFS